MGGAKRSRALLDTFRCGQIAGATGGSATSVEVNTDPSCSDPGFEPQVQKAISAKGVLSLGPFAVAVVTELVEAE